MDIAICDSHAVRKAAYAPAAAKALRRHGNVAARIMDKVTDYAAGIPMPGSVKMLSTGHMRLRVGDYRVIFTQTETTVTVPEIGPRGGVYDD